MPKLFGTDGVRGIANDDLSPELAFKLGQAGAACLAPQGTFIVGKDTRLSGDLLESALISGICSAGTKVIRVGVMPTPGVAYLTKTLRANGGVVISASHNPAEHNGIKFFTGEGFKASEELEEHIEQAMEDGPADRPTGAKIGVVKDAPEAAELYINHLVETIPGDFEGFRVAIDCAHGAASQISPTVLRQLGVDVMAVNTTPNGLNINKGCGSTHIDYIQEIVSSHNVDLGLAHDGDADRVLAIDETGEVVDGDFIMAICAALLKSQGLLTKNAVVTTVMTNLGFHLAMKNRGIEVYKTSVGDRYVLEEMLARGVTLGGEQSGHIIFLNDNTTGDGLLTALKLMAVMRDTGQRLSQLRQIMRRLPQVLINVPVVTKDGLNGNKVIDESVARGEKALDGKGRVLVRPSGTEPLVRIMVESETDALAQSIASEIAGIIKQELG